MNARQFINSALCAAIEKRQYFGSILFGFTKLLFPSFIYQQFSNFPFSKNFFRLFLTVYIIVFIFCFGIQAYLALESGHFHPDSSIKTTMFLEDHWNLINYVILVELYCFFGVGFIISLFAIEKGFKDNGLGNYFDIATQSDGQGGKLHWLYGTVSLLLVLAIPLLFGAQYGVEARLNSKTFFWFHDQTDAGVKIYGYRGYYYLYLNAFLLFFVGGVATLHFGMYRWARILSNGIRSQIGDVPARARVLWLDDNKIKQLFSPFTETTIWSKAFLLCLAANILTWKMSKVTIVDDKLIGLMDWSILITGIIGIWIVSVPRYLVQYQIFKVRKGLGIHEYKDIRMPWVLGWSGFVDVIIIAYLGKVLVSESSQKFLTDWVGQFLR